MLMTHYRQPIDWTPQKLEEAVIELYGFKHSIVEDDDAQPSPEILDALKDDLNTPRAIAELRRLAKETKKNLPINFPDSQSPHAILYKSCSILGITLKNSFLASDLVTNKVDIKLIEKLRDERLAARKAKNWAEADRIRDELEAMGIALKDAKDPETGEIVTTWEIAR
jgi:cysteinyl-tRNA synthetase